MKNHLAARVAAISLLLSSAPLIAAELPFSAPSTPRAQESAKLLHRAAHALYDSAPSAARISDLWLFPTAERDTVFAEYTLRTGEQSASTEHLVELTLHGDRILRIRELTDAAAEPAHQQSASLDWTAMIGTGGTTKPANASAADPPSFSGAQISRAVPHWTSKIGTGSAAESNSGLKTSAPALVANCTD